MFASSFVLWDDTGSWQIAAKTGLEICWKLDEMSPASLWLDFIRLLRLRTVVTERVPIGLCGRRMETNPVKSSLGFSSFPSSAKRNRLKSPIFISYSSSTLFYAYLIQFFPQICSVKDKIPRLESLGVCQRFLILGYALLIHSQASAFVANSLILCWKQVSFIIAVFVSWLRRGRRLYILTTSHSTWWFDSLSALPPSPTRSTVRSAMVSSFRTFWLTIVANVTISHSCPKRKEAGEESTLFSFCFHSYSSFPCSTKGREKIRTYVTNLRIASWLGKKEVKNNPNRNIAGLTIRPRVMFELCQKSWWRGNWRVGVEPRLSLRLGRVHVLSVYVSLYVDIGYKESKANAST